MFTEARTLSIGLGLNATVPFFNRMRQEERPGDGPGFDVSGARGFIVTVYSNLRSLRLWDEISARIAASCNGKREFVAVRPPLETATAKSPEIGKAIVTKYATAPYDW